MGGKVNTEKVEINLSVSDLNQEGGYDSVNDSVIAQLRSHSDEYQQTSENVSELTGMVIERNGKFYFTNMVEVPINFEATVNLQGFSQKDIAGLVHTHPDNYTFTGVDFESPANLRVPSFVRDRRGNVYRWEVKGALKYQKYVEGLKRSKTAQTYEDGVKNSRRWQISNLCEGGNLCLN